MIKYALWLLLIIHLLAIGHYRRWEQNILGGGDSYGYYIYLPAAFIYGDMDSLTLTHAARLKYHPGFSGSSEIDIAQKVEGTDHRVIKYTLGIALLQAPFFALGHIIAKVFKAPADGFSLPYMLAIQLSVLVYVFWGLWLLSKVLLQYFSPNLTAGLILILGLATNLYFFVVYNGPMAHSYLFFLYALLLWLTIRFYESPGRYKAMLIGACCGLITLIRPAEIICIAIPLAYIPALGWRIFWGKQFRLLLPAVLVFAGVGFLQMVYWKVVSGNWLFYSYGEEGFNFLRPLIRSGLISYNNGWLVYTPIMLLALIGIGFMPRQAPSWFRAVLIFLPVHIYITYSWWCWYYINGLGSRPMIETYPLLAIPLGCTLYRMYQVKAIRPLAFLLPLIFGAAHLFQTEQYYRGVLWSEAANEVYFWSVFGKLNLKEENLYEFDDKEKQPDSTDLVFSKQLFYNDFETEQDASIRSTCAHHGAQGFELNNSRKEYSILKTTAREIDLHKDAYLKVKAYCRKDQPEYSWYTMNRIAVHFKRKKGRSKFRQIRLENKLGNDQISLWGGRTGLWDEVHFYIKTPDWLSPEDSVKVLALPGSNHPVCIDNFSLEAWTPKK